jgi:hypothetical protein
MMEKTVEHEQLPFIPSEWLQRAANWLSREIAEGRDHERDVHDDPDPTVISLVVRTNEVETLQRGLTALSLSLKEEGL